MAAKQKKTAKPTYMRIKLKDFLRQWDTSSRKQRSAILDQFIVHFNEDVKQSLVYQLERELGEICPLFFSRIISSFQMNHMRMNMVDNHIEALLIYFRSRDGKQYVERFTNSGGIQMILYVLQNRDKQPMKLQSQCLSIIHHVIKSNCDFKEVICLSDGVPLLLEMVVDPINSDDHELLYSLYIILKRLCIRNAAYTPSIHQWMIDHIQLHMDNEEGVKTLLRVLQSTLSFDDDVRIKSARPKNHHTPNRMVMDGHSSKTQTVESIVMQEIEDIDVIHENNVKDILQLIALENHQISYELNKLCAVILKSAKGQMILLSSLLDIIAESEEEMRKHYEEFTTELVDGNEKMLTEEVAAMLSERNPDLLPSQNQQSDRS